MMAFRERCPGSMEIRTPYPEDIFCPWCGSVLEIWSDEAEIACGKCRRAVSRGMKHSCIEWCPAAKECLGNAKYEKLMKDAKG